MKKILSILMMICLIANALSVTSFAALLETFDAAPVGVVLRVSGLEKDGTTTPDTTKDYHNLVDGWNAAIEAALTNNHDRIVVDFYADWVATDGEFCDDGIGFSYDAIYIPENVRITLNLNGHTINRAMTTWEYNGEVMFIDEDADVIINDGTITGGWSCNGAGGIHVMDNATLTLNDVNITGNTADDDDGGGIAVYDGATLVVNGGSLSGNRLIGAVSGSFGGAVYVNDSTATFNGVEFKNNLSDSDSRYGAAVSAVNSMITLNNCTFEGNGLETSNTSSTNNLSIIYGSGSSIMVENCTFNNNRADSMLFVSATYLAVNASVFKDISDTEFLIKSQTKSTLHVMSTTFSDNKAYAVSARGSKNDIDSDSFFKNCTFKNTNGEKGTFTNIFTDLLFYDCAFYGCSSDSQIRKYIKTSYSAVSREEAVIGVTVLQEDGTTVLAQYFKDLVTGWSFAMNAAGTGLYGRVIVDLYTDWVAVDDQFTEDFENGDGFNWDTLFIPENARVTLNMNNHTIDRHSTASFIPGKINGEVLYISKNADVIINDGKITGGRSVSGAGGIHIMDNARVVLNNVKVDVNRAQTANGSAIAVYNGAVLIMNGGSMIGNYSSGNAEMLIGIFPFGTLYVEEATATLNNVIMRDNGTGAQGDGEGALIYADESTVTLNDCVVSGNARIGIGDYAESIIAAVDSKLIINNTDFTGNGSASKRTDTDYSYLFYIDDSSLTMTGGKITGNGVDKLFYFEGSEADVTGVTITGNACGVVEVDKDNKTITFTECVLNDNIPNKKIENIIVEKKDTLVLKDCELGNTTFNDKNMVMGVGVGSIFGEGSLTMIFAIVAVLALVASGVSIFMVASMKKKLVPVAANNAAETEDEE